MKSFKSFYQDIFHANKSTFDQLALKVFRYQAVNNTIYKSYIENLGIDANKISRVDEIPFLPISFFKTQTVKTGAWQPEVVFESSGTTGLSTSRHYVRSVEFYLENTERIFNYFYGPLDQYHILALLPSYLERGNSSLVLMADYFIKRSGSNYSGFYLHDLDRLLDTIKQIRGKRRILLLGVSFALLDLAEKYRPDLGKVQVMETGGMKGRRKEIIRSELHRQLHEGLNTWPVHSEYGMTELLSQAYSTGSGIFHCPPWMKVILRDTNDPFDFNLKRNSGGINIIDLANVDSCAFIETQDIGKKMENGGFEVMGRFDNTDIRGCNLMIF